MKPSIACLDLIRNSEGLQLTAYRDCAGVLTCGWGHTGEDVKEGMTVSLSQAEAWLEDDANVVGQYVTHLAGQCNQGQFDAFTDFVFNMGSTRFAGSTLLHKHKAGNFTGAAAEFGRWIYAGQPPHAEPGLIKRRAAEAHLYLSGELPPSVEAQP